MPGVTRTKLMRAEARSEEARHRLKRTLDELKARLTPAALAETAQEEIADVAETAARKGAALARRHPVKVIGGAALVLALAARRFFRKRKATR
jgi:hypothetical protein